MAYNPKPRIRLSDPKDIRCPGRTNLFCGTAEPTNAFPLTPKEEAAAKAIRTKPTPKKAKVGVAPSMLAAFGDTKTREIPKGRFVPKGTGRVPSGVDGKGRKTRVL